MCVFQSLKPLVFWFWSSVLITLSSPNTSVKSASEHCDWTSSHPLALSGCYTSVTVRQDIRSAALTETPTAIARERTWKEEFVIYIHVCELVGILCFLPQ